MNDRDRLRLERLFDGEPDEDDREALGRELSEDPAARRHLDELGFLRALARSHDPAGSATPPRAARPAVRSARRRLPLAAAALAAGLLALMALPAGPPADRVPAARALAPPAPPPRRPAAVSPAPSPRVEADRPIEVGLYLWANAPSRPSEQAARLILARDPSPRRRTASQDVLVLELANATPGAIGKVRRVAVSRGVPPAGRSAGLPPPRDPRRPPRPAPDESRS
jgi:hypothetical protein